MNVALYARVSTEDQSVEVQLRELRQAAAMRGWTVVQEFTDVISGSKAARPGLDALLVLAKTKAIQAVVAVKIDRLGRSLANFLQLAQKLADMKVAIVCTSQGIDTSNENPCGEMIRGILMVIAQFERSLIIERTKAGLAAARARGVKLGAPSKKLPGTDEERIQIVNTWRIEGMPGGYRALGVRLGGVSGATAHRVAAKVKPPLPTAPEEAPA